MKQREIAGIPWRDWVPDFKFPTHCQAVDCEQPIRRAVYANGCQIAKNGEPLEPAFAIHVFTCAEHGDEIEELLLLMARGGVK